MSVLPAALQPTRDAFLTRTTPAARLVAGVVWLVASVVTLDPIVPVRLAVAAIVVLWLWSGLPMRRIPGRLAPLGFAVLSLTVFSILLSSANGDRSLATLAQFGPALPLLQGLPYDIGEEADKDMRLHPSGLLMPDGAQREIAFLDAEGGLDPLLKE